MMYIVWWSVALIMFGSYFVLEWKLWRAGVERVYGNKRVTLPGRRWHYIVAAFGIGFMGFSAIFLGLLEYANIRFQITQGTICWLSGALLIGGINLINVGARLKYFDFGDQLP
jgi:hypothetical protein